MDDDLFALLKQWGFCSLYEDFVENGITVNTLKVILERDLDILFKDKKIGCKIEFRAKLWEWRKMNVRCFLFFQKNFPINEKFYFIEHSWS